jgi:hypothetical protein
MDGLPTVCPLAALNTVQLGELAVERGPRSTYGVTLIVNVSLSRAPVWSVTCSVNV